MILRIAMADEIVGCGLPGMAVAFHRKPSIAILETKSNHEMPVLRSLGRQGR